MESRRRTGERNGGLQAAPKLSKERHRREHHRKSKDLDRRVRKDPSRTEARPDHPPAKLPKESLGLALSGNDNYVRRWLAQTESDTNQRDALVTRETTSNQERSRVAHAEFPSRRTPLNSADVPGPSKRKKRHDSSSDSSLLEAPIRPQSHQLKRDEPRPVLLKQLEIQSTPPRKKQRVDSSDSGLTIHSVIPSPPKDTFEKRPRHKTREDRYEPKKKDEKQRKIGKGNPERKKRERKGDREKATKKAGEELIQNFRSKNIAQDRLTIRPSNGLGLFNNGRASSPARRRGLPDLAFSEMEFLQHSRTRQHNEKENMVKSRSREKDKKASRVQDEIATFFRPNRAPLQDVSSSLGGPSSELLTFEPNLYVMQLESERDARKHRSSEPLDLHPRPNRGFGAAGTLSDRYQESHNYNASPEVSHSINPPGSASRVSGKATTYVSWSESQRSPVSTSHHGNFGQRHVSLTPDFVRRSIEKTGIFRDTGIGRVLDLNQANGSPTMYESQDLRIVQDSRHGNSSEQMSTEMPSSSEGGLKRSEVLQQDRDIALRDLSRHDTRDDLPERADKVPSTDQIAMVKQNGTSRKRIVIEHFDPTLGWREDPSAVEHSQQISAAAMRPDDSHTSKPTPLTREEIAKKVRVIIPKRPSTTVPVIRETSNETHLPLEDEQDSRMPTSNTISNPQISEDVRRASSSRVFVNSAQRPLLSRASNLSLPTIYEDSDEQSASHGEASRPERQPGSKTSPQASQPRLSSNRNNSQNHSESHLQQHTQANYHTVQESSQWCDVGSRNVTYLGLHTSGAWLGTSLGSTTVGPASLPTMAGGQSLYVRQMQRPPTFYQLKYDGANSAVDEAYWEPSGPTALAYDHGQGDQQHVDDLAESAYAIDHSIGPAAYQTYERGLDNVNEEHYNQLGIWNAEARDADQNGVYDVGEGQDYRFYEHKHMDAEQNHSVPHQGSYQGIDGDYGVQTNTPRTGFWQPRPQF